MEALEVPTGNAETKQLTCRTCVHWNAYFEQHISLWFCHGRCQNPKSGYHLMGRWRDTYSCGEYEGREGSAEPEEPKP